MPSVFISLVESHMTTDSYMRFWEIFLLEGLELSIKSCVIEGRREKTGG